VKESSGLFGEKNANATPSQIQKLSWVLKRETVVV
jgi:hypothetical protein